ncbi:hypothetical protein P7C71_g3481, partial [Lecanoromycetidae sp. Uapishka_2]
MYSSDYSNTAKYNGFSQESSFEEKSNVSAGLTTRESVELFQEAVDTAKSEYQKPSLGSDTTGEPLKPKLTVDLRRQGLSQLPKEVIAIIKQDVESGSLLTIVQIFGLPQLEILDLSRNRLKEIPNDIEALKALRVFSIQHNNLEDLPDGIGTITTLRMLKVMGNPLSAGLRRIIGSSEMSPSFSPALLKDDNERDTMTTRPIKDYLVARAAVVKESGEDSSDGPVETPRALSRFPVHPHHYGHSTSGSESASDLRSPGFIKPPIPARSHYRVPSVQGNSLQVNVNRRPGLAPLTIGNERNRSNSESILQATQNNKMKRMGIVRKKDSDLGLVDETRINRNSHHFRGQSHGSALRNGIRAGDSSPSGGVSPHSGGGQRGMVVRRLSSLPEQRRENLPTDNIVEGARGVLYALHLVHGHISTLSTVVKDSRTKRSSLERVFSSATIHIEHLDQELLKWDRLPDPSLRSQMRSRKAISKATHACIVAHQHVSSTLMENVKHLVRSADPRYIRTLLLLLYGSLNEMANASKTLLVDGPKIKIQRNGTQRVSTISEVSNEGARPLSRAQSVTPTRERPKPERKWRMGSNLQQSTSHSNLQAAYGGQASVPLYLNGRSRSNSRAGNMHSSASSSVVSTPRSGETFITSSLAIRSRSGSVNVTPEQARMEKEQAAQFEKIFIILKEAANEGLRAIPQLEPYFVNSLEASRNQSTHPKVRESWATLVERSRYCMEMSEILNMRLSTVRLNDAEARNARDFWHLVKSFIDSYSSLLLSLKEARRYTPIPNDVKQLVKPVHTSSTEAAMLITNSPWNRLTFEIDPQTTLQPQTYLPQENGFPHHRSKGSGGSASGSISSPYSNVPATPLSAALGPAAQATVPATPASASLEDSFQGNIFQRADTWQKQQTMQQTMIFRR